MNLLSWTVERCRCFHVSLRHILMTIAHTLLWTNFINVWCRSPSTYSWALSQASNISRHQDFCLSLGEDTSLALQAWTLLLRIEALHQTGSCVPPQPTASKHPVSIYVSAQALVLKDTVHAFLHMSQTSGLRWRNFIWAALVVSSTPLLLCLSLVILEELKTI